MLYFLFFFFNDPATTEIYTLSLHDALPICSSDCPQEHAPCSCCTTSKATRTRRSPGSSASPRAARNPSCSRRSEEHTSELQSRRDLVCRLLLEKKKKKNRETNTCRTKRRNR